MMRRIGIVTPDIVGPVKNGGIGTACFHYARTLASAGYGVDVLFSGEIGRDSCDRWKAWYASFGIEFSTLDDVPRVEVALYGARWPIERAQRIMDFLRERRYDYLLFQDWHANGFWAVRSRKMGASFPDTPIGVIAHSPNEWQKEGMRTFGRQPLEDSALEWAEREAIAHADILVSPSHHMVEWLRRHGYALPQEISICPYTFEDEIVPGAPAAADVDHIVFFGRLETRKGLHLLGGALRLLAKQGRRLPSRVSLLGKRAEVAGLHTDQYIASLAADLPTVKFDIESDFDYREAVDYIRRHNGIVVIPSILDNYPLTVIECITNGFCFIASNAGGIPEMVDPTVRFVPNSAALADKLAALSSIDFETLSHPYNPAEARQRWLEHVERVTSKPTCSVRVFVTRDTVPSVSVCVPFYHHDRYIDRLVGAFLRMQIPNLQLVLINDGTPPEHRRRFDALRRALEPLGHVFVDQTNMGPGAARNRAARLATHDLLLFFDADNVPFPDMVERLCSALLHVNADSMAAAYVGVPPMTRRPVSDDIVMQYRPPGGPISVALLDNILGDSCSLVRKSVFQAVGGFTEERASWEDWEFFVRVVGQGYQHWVYPEPLFFYTVDGEGRYRTASAYENRRSLLRSLRALPAQVSAEVAAVFAMESIVVRR